MSRNLISKSLAKPTRELLTDVSELGLDEVIDKVSRESELLKQLPIVKWLFIGNDIRSTFQSAFFIKKYSQFIGKLSHANMSEDDSEKLLELTLDDGKIEKIVDNTILYLDRYQNELKAQLLGELFIQTFKNRSFTAKEYNSLMFSIELIHPYTGIDTLVEFYEYKERMDAESDDKKKREIWTEGSKIDYAPLSTSGLLKLPVGGSIMGDIGGAYLNDLGRRFYELVVCNCNVIDDNA
ncbi:hypothetical protein [Moritella sp.]|uniref:hypothetical protein n=1 Tax=Moritella sp. TaxID=78556 RepID=UPI001DBF8AB0|nr:hypothetical protein [Moritella sp.]MCJ8350891.1 hypothetical protein [Moritella sp.]NQZ40423.1 hypothetical protein [Moritella sp.]